jgi:hypothetical protein
MKTIAGLWIDHKKAIVVTLSDDGEETTRQILSNVEKQRGRSNGTRSTASFESQLVQEDDRQQRGFTKHLAVFYDEVLTSIQNAQTILIFGPGEAKGELKKLMEQNNRGEKLVTLETADKMTDAQVAAEVRRYYKNDGKR